jgi:hypothetical protein
MRQLIGSVLLLAAVGLVPAELAAQRRVAARPADRAQRPSFGVQLDWASDTDFGIGGRGVFALQSLFPKTPLDAIVSFDYYFPSGAPAGTSVHFWEINGNVAYRFRVPARSSLRPYAGGGLNIAHASASAGGVSASSTDAGLNLLGGTTFKVNGSLTPFAEFRGVVGNANQVVLTGGVRF